MADLANTLPGLRSPGHTQSRQPTLYAATISTGVIAALAVSLRLLARRLSKAKFWYDDYLIVLSLFNLAAIIYVAIWSIQDGLGLPYSAVGSTSVHNVLKRTFYAEFLYTTLLCLVKYSILAFYWRTFDVPRMRWATGALTFIVTGHTIGVICTYLLQCRPVAQFWLRSDPWACPIDEKAFMTYSAFPNIGTDIGLLVLPLVPIWSLEKNVKQKIALSVVFGLGSV
ncbi:MAG: hypothetical protein MMC23_008360 [Stictis urceolatum]|nr:hypothetical protein [Stictis urceolata]